jgi:hypothetical protein
MVPRRRVAVTSAGSAAAGGLVWVALLTAGLSAGLATAISGAVTIGLACLTPWRRERQLLGLALGYAFAFVLLEAPIWILLVLVLNSCGGD